MSSKSNDYDTPMEMSLLWKSFPTQVYPTPMHLRLHQKLAEKQTAMGLTDSFTPFYDLSPHVYYGKHEIIGVYFMEYFNGDMRFVLVPEDSHVPFRLTMNVGIIPVLDEVRL